jgi:hypothetical protein
MAFVERLNVFLVFIKGIHKSASKEFRFAAIGTYDRTIRTF